MKGKVVTSLSSNGAKFCESMYVSNFSTHQKCFNFELINLLLSYANLCE
jgi:hypothetical protein